MLTSRTALLLLLSAALPSACLDSSAQTEVSKTVDEVNVNADWTSKVNVTTIGAGNGLQKTGGTNGQWDAGAITTQTIGGHGFVRFTTAEYTKAKAIGLSSGNNAQGLSDIDHAVKLGADGHAYVYHNGTSIQDLGAYDDTSVFQIEATPTSILYKKKDSNGVFQTLHTDSFSSASFPLLVDTSLRDTDATLGNVVVNQDTKLHIAVQDDFLDSTVSPRCGVNDVISISSRHFLCYHCADPDDPACQGCNDGPTTIHQFSLTQIQDVQDRLVAFAGDKNITAAEVYGTVIIDIESPNLKDLWTYSVSQQSDIIEGFVTRINAAHNVFPNAKLGLYGTLVPQGTGYDPQPEPVPPTDYQQRRARLIWAGEHGLYEEPLDYLVPVLYVKFGCDDDGSPFPCDDGWDTIDEFTQMGITDSKLLRRMDDSELPLLPLLSFWVDNKEDHTSFDEDLILDLDMPDPLGSTLGLQLSLLKANTVDDAVLWKGKCTDETVRDGVDTHDCTTTNDVVLDDYTCSL